MLYADAINFVPTFVLAFFRLAGLMIMSPLFGSARIPKRMKILFAGVTTLGVMGAIKQPVMFPDSLAALTIGLTGEFVFGLAMGTVASFTFIAAQWAGEMVGQQIGFNLSAVFDPQYGQAGTLVGDMYFMLTLVIFLAINGHHQLLQAVHESFVTAPLLSLAFDRPLFDGIVDLFTGATILAMRLAAPIFFTMLVVDLSMGVISRAMPQFNIMSAGMSLKTMIGITILLVGLVLTTDTLHDSLQETLNYIRVVWPAGGPTHG
ncbi:MAG TPA: flagellar biosynthetic protein FliR [Tepidisphaeraceae bacterium]|jgi:flagellar biosynthetic protein FliR